MIAKTKTVSLIIPAYNEERYIASCLDYAILNGKEYIDEIIVIDNASTDRTATIAQSYSDRYPHIRVIREDNKGVTRARQRGYKEASSELLAFTDADTRMPPGWAAEMQRRFQRDPKLGVLTGPYDYYDMNTMGRMGNWIYWTCLAYPMDLLLGHIGVGGNFIIKKEVLDAMEGFDTTIEFYGDETNTTRRAKEFSKVKFSLRFKMPTSARRFGQQGMLSTIVLYISSYFSEVVLHRTFIKKYKDYR